MSDFERFGQYAWKIACGIVAMLAAIMFTAWLIGTVGVTTAAIIWFAGVPAALVALIMGIAMLWAAIAPVIRWWKGRGSV